MRKQADSDHVSRPNTSYTVLFLALALLSVLIFMPRTNELFPFKLGAIFVLVFFLPGLLLASAIFKRTEIDGLELVGISLTFSLIILPLIGLSLNITYHEAGQLQILAAILAVTAVLLCLVLLKDSSRIQSSIMFLQRLLPILRRYQGILAIVAFATAVRLVSFLFLRRNSISSDIDIWLVQEIVDGRLLSGYTSIWHYLGLAPYSYPIFFHLLAASVKILAQLRSSDLFLINLVPSLIPLLFCYAIVKNSNDEKSATVSVFALCTAPIFIFDTLPGTFKARALFYVFISAELYCASMILRGQRKFWPLLFIFGAASALTYREAIAMNALIVAVLVSTILTQGQRMPLRLMGTASAIFGSVLFAFSYVAYTPSLGLAETVASGLLKQGPILMFCLVGAVYSIRKGEAVNHFLTTVTLVGFAVVLFNWKAADSAPILLAPLSGVGLTYFFGLLEKLKRFRLAGGPRVTALTILMIGLATTAFGLTYYPNKYYINAKPEVFDEIETIRQFVLESKPQKGAVVYGTGFTGLSLQEAYASVFVLGPEQKTFFDTYSLHHFVFTNFDPWIIKHPEIVYESTLQLHRSLYTHDGESLRQFLESFCIQYLIVENASVTDSWAQSNKESLEERFVTQHYRVYESLLTRPFVGLLRSIDGSLSEDAKILTPYYMSPAVHESRREYLVEDLGALFDFNHVHLYERIRGRPQPTEALDSLRMKIETLTVLYDDPLQLVRFASENGFDYVVSDHLQVRDRLLGLGQKLLFSEGDLALFEIDKTYATQSSTTSNITSDGSHALAVNIFEATSYTPERYALTSPATGVGVELQRDGKVLTNGYTDNSGTIVFYVPSGEYTILVSTDAARVERQFKVDSYTFAPIVIHKQEEDPMQRLLGPFLLLIAALALISNLSIRKSRPNFSGG